MSVLNSVIRECAIDQVQCMSGEVRSRELAQLQCTINATYSTVQSQMDPIVYELKGKQYKVVVGVYYVVCYCLLVYRGFR